MNNKIILTLLSERRTWWTHVHPHKDTYSGKQGHGTRYVQLKQIPVLSLASLQYHLHEDKQDITNKKASFLKVVFYVHYLFAKLILQKYNVQCCLISTGQQSDSVVNIYTFFFIFFSITVYHRILNTVPYAIYSRILFIHPIHSSLHMPIPSSKSIPSPSPTTSLFSISVTLFFFCRYIYF